MCITNHWLSLTLVNVIKLLTEIIRVLKFFRKILSHAKNKPNKLLSCIFQMCKAGRRLGQDPGEIGCLSVKLSNTYACVFTYAQIN